MAIALTREDVLLDLRGRNVVLASPVGVHVPRIAGAPTLPMPVRIARRQNHAVAGVRLPTPTVPAHRDPSGPWSHIQISRPVEPEPATWMGVPHWPQDPFTPSPSASVPSPRSTRRASTTSSRTPSTRTATGGRSRAKPPATAALVHGQAVDADVVGHRAGHPVPRGTIILPPSASSPPGGG